MDEDLKNKCEQTFYSELYQFDESSRGLIMDQTTGRIYLKKTLETYDIEVYRWLHDHRNIHIPAIHSFHEEDGRLIVLEEYIQGETLESLMSRVSLNRSYRIRILTDICDTLIFLHSARVPIIHRDIKPSNIMITEDGILKLIDYDAAKIYHKGKKEDTTLIGTPGRAAPEQYGFGQSDARTDVYSMGTLIREMFPQDKGFEAVAAKATAMDPKDRYQSIKELKAAIMGAEPRIFGTVRPRRAAVFIVAAVLVLCLVMFMMGLHSGKNKSVRDVMSSEASKTADTVSDRTDAASAMVDTVSTEKGTEEKASEEAPSDSPASASKAVAATSTESTAANTGTSNAGSTTANASADGPQLHRDGFIIEESFCYITGSQGSGCVHYGAILSNPDTENSVEFPTIRVTAKDREGNILGTGTQVGGIILPGDHVALTSLTDISGFKSKNDVIVGITSVSGDIKSDKDHPASTDFEVEGIAERSYGFGPEVLGEITSKYTETVSVAVTALYRKEGELVYGYTTFVDDLRPGEPTAFELSPAVIPPPHDSVEVMVQEF